MEKVYKYKLDFLYRSLIIYMVFFIVYAVIRGKVLEGEFRFLLNDPLIYILLLFNLIFIVVVIYHLILDKKIIIKGEEIIFRNRFGQRSLNASDIMSIRIKKKRRGDDEMPYKIIRIKLKNRKRLLRIRTSDFENGSDLIKELLKFNTAKQN
jgi:hypothetical protein